MHMIDGHLTDSITAVMSNDWCHRSDYQECKQNTRVDGASDCIHLFKKSR